MPNSKSVDKECVLNLFSSHVHEMSAEEDGPILLVLDEEVPGGPPGIGVHPRGGLVQHHQLGTTNQSNAHTAQREKQRVLIPPVHGITGVSTAIDLRMVKSHNDS